MGNFAEEFTRLEPVYSPPGSPPSGDPRIFQVSEGSGNLRCGGGRMPLATSALADPWVLHRSRVLIRTQYLPLDLSTHEVPGGCRS